MVLSWLGNLSLVLRRLGNLSLTFSWFGSLSLALHILCKETLLFAGPVQHAANIRVWLGLSDPHLSAAAA